MSGFQNLDRETGLKPKKNYHGEHNNANKIEKSRLKDGWFNFNGYVNIHKWDNDCLSLLKVILSKYISNLKS